MDSSYIGFIEVYGDITVLDARHAIIDQLGPSKRVKRRPQPSLVTRFNSLAQHFHLLTSISCDRIRFHQILSEQGNRL